MKYSLFVLLFLVVGTVSTSGVIFPNGSAETQAAYGKVKTPLPAPEKSALALPSGAEVLTTNVLSNGDFEDIGSNGLPSSFTYGGSGNSWGLLNYSANVHGGTYAAQVYAESTLSSQSALVQYIPSSYTFLNQSLVLDFWGYFSNPSLPGPSTIFISFSVSSSLGYRQIYVYLSTNSPSYTDYSTLGYYVINQTLESWNNVVLNITQLFDDKFPGSTGARLTSINFNVNSVYSGTPSSVSMILDDVSLTNRTGGALLSGGDFEGATQGWYTQYKTSSPTIASPSLPGRGRVINMTVDTSDSKVANAYLRSYMYGPVNLIPVIEGVRMVFDYNVVPGGGNPTTTVSLSMYNGSYYVNLYLYLWGNVQQNTTSSTSRTIGLNVTSSESGWRSFEMDLYSFLSSEGLSGFGIQSVSASLLLSSEGYQSSFALDNLGFISHPVLDPTFDFDSFDTTSTPLGLWSGGGAVGVAQTDRGRSASVNTTAGVNNFITRDFSSRLYRGDFVNFAWKVTSATFAFSTAIEFFFSFEDYRLSYFIGNVSSSSYSNSSSDAYYILSPEIGSWNVLYRDIVSDLEDVFGKHAVWNLTRLRINVFAGTGGEINALFDDFYFIRDASPPTIGDVSLLGSPVYYRNTSISFNVTDSMTEVVNASLIYRSAGGDWNLAQTTLVDGGIVATIPSFSYGTVVEYYIFAEDSIGNSGRSSTFSFTVGDDLVPTFSLLSPRNNSRVSGTIDLDFEVYDAGSGFDNITVYLNSTRLVSLSAPSTTVSLDTRTLDNGVNRLVVNVTDRAGNYFSTSVFLDVWNDFFGPDISDVILNPDPPEKDVPVSVSVAVTDDTNVSRVTLYYRIDDGDWSELEMTGHGGIYTSSLPAIGEGQTMSYYVRAVDAFDQETTKGSASDPFTYSFPVPEGLDKVIAQGQELYDQYTLYVGMASMVLLYVFLKVIGRKFRGKKKKS